MVEKQRQTSKKRYWGMFLLVFGFLLVLHTVIFRHVVVSIPEILRGDKVLVRDELVPFFDFHSQFISQIAGGESALTLTDEVRLSYSFWTAWVRYYTVLPFALVILNSVSAFMLFYAFFIIGRHFNRGAPKWHVLASLMAALVIHLILLYSKITHFYALILGFSLFSLGLSLTLEQLYFRKKLQLNRIFLISSLVLLNPAIHYHVLFYLFLILAVSMHLVLGLFDEKRGFMRKLRKDTFFSGSIILLSLVPYMLLIKFATSHGSAATSSFVPVNYWMINFTSINMPYLFSLDTTAQIDLFRYGSYLVSKPRILMFGFSFFAFSAVILKWRTLHRKVRVFVLSLMMLLLLSMWMAQGYANSFMPSFHSLLRDLSQISASSPTYFTDKLAGTIFAFINVLRFPHRFQFMEFYFVGLLLMLSILWAKHLLIRVVKLEPVVILLLIIIPLFPVIATRDYRSAFLSGDFDTFLHPYTLSKDLKDIRKLLNQGQDKRLFILPSLESGREIEQDSVRHSFIDKFLIYYLGQPTFYYGVGASVPNKTSAFLVYRSISYHEDWWENILIDNLGITDILRPKHVIHKKLGLTYSPEIDSKINDALMHSKRFKKIYDGSEYELYDANKTNAGPETLLDMSWKELLNYLNETTGSRVHTFFPSQMKNLSTDKKLRLITDSVERSYYDLRGTLEPTFEFYPKAYDLPFDRSIVDSSVYTNNMFSLFTIYSPNNSYNYLRQALPTLVNMRSESFVGLSNTRSKVSIPFTVAAQGQYKVLIRGAAKTQNIMGTLDNREVQFKKVAGDADDQNQLDFTYFHSDMQLAKGPHELNISGDDKLPFLIESLQIVPQRLIPDFKAENIISPEFELLGSENVLDKLHSYELQLKSSGN